MKPATFIFALAGLSVVAFAQEEKTKPNPIAITLEQYEHVENSEGFVVAKRRNDHWEFSIPSNYSGYNIGWNCDKAVLKGEGFEIPIGIGMTFDQAQRTEFSISDKMIESAVLEIWSRSWGNFGTKSSHFRIKLSDIAAKGEQGGAGQPATRPELKSEGSDKPQPEAEGRSR